MPYINKVAHIEVCEWAEKMVAERARLNAKIEELNLLLDLARISLEDKTRDPADAVVYAAICHTVGPVLQ